LAVHVEAVPHYRFVIVGATLLKRAFAQSVDDNVRICDKLDDGIERGAVRVEELIQFPDLVDRARVPINEKALLGIRLGKPMPNQFIGKGIRNIVAGIHERLRLLPKLSLMAHVIAENVASRYRRNPVRLR